MNKKALFWCYRAVHVRVQELQEVFVFPTRECAAHCMQSAHIHTTSNECNISDREILQVDQLQFPVVSLQCLLTKRNLITMVSIILTSLMCGQMRIPTLLKANINYVLVSVCGVQLWTIRWLEGRLTGEAYLRFLQEELPRLLEDVHLNKRGIIYFQHDVGPKSSRKMRNFLIYRFPLRWLDMVVPTIGQPGLQFFFFVMLGSGSWCPRMYRNLQAYCTTRNLRRSNLHHQISCMSRWRQRP